MMAMILLMMNGIMKVILKSWAVRIAHTSLLTPVHTSHSAPATTSQPEYQPFSLYSNLRGQN